jgi:hypothetical protein
MKIPDILSQSQINPFDNDRHALNNKKYDNIHILGNIFNHIYSISAVNEMSKVMAQNVYYNLIGIRKKVSY